MRKASLLTSVDWPKFAQLATEGFAEFIRLGNTEEHDWRCERKKCPWERPKSWSTP
jgi:hypothetical protein